MAKGFQPQCILHTVLMAIVIAAITALSIAGDISGETAILVILAAAGIGSTGIAGVTGAPEPASDVLDAETRLTTARLSAKGP
jgi:hypothetical protein